jgi:hypothetical protein
VLAARREIDGETPAERVEVRLRTGKALAREQQRILAVRAQGRPAQSRELGIDEGEVEFRVVDDQPVAADEGEQLVGDRGEGRMPREEFFGEAMDFDSLRRHLALGIDIAVECPSGRHMIEQLDAADLDDAMAARWIEPGGFGVENDLAHGGQSAAADSATQGA